MFCKFEIKHKKCHFKIQEGVGAINVLVILNIYMKKLGHEFLRLFV